MNDDEIRLVLPAIPEYARVARLTVAGLATRLGFSYDEVEDLRIAIGEACSMLMAAEPTGQLTVRYVMQDGGLEVVTATEPGEPLVVSDLSEQILAAVVDRHEIDRDAHRVRLVKHQQG